jgi:UDP-N-acetylglucosamine--dolichyl-phosphate N-acetylglucosaminephosphotransferase
MIIEALTLSISFIFALISTPAWIKSARRAGLVSRDIHRPGAFAADIGGLPVVFGFSMSILFYIALQVFSKSSQQDALVLFLAALCSVLIALLIGLVDDISGWKIGLRRRYKIALSFLIPLPIMVVNAGTSTMNFPLLGPVELGIFFPLLVIPIGVVGAANAFNMYAGYNGLEAGQGIILLSTLGTISYLAGSVVAAVLAFAMVAALLAFLVFNFYPARVFPGDTMTYPVGALVAIVAIVGNVEKFAVMAFALYYVQFLLKARGGMARESFARITSRGFLVLPYRRLYGLEHVGILLITRIAGRVTQVQLVVFLLLMQAAICLPTLVYFALS